MKRSRATLSARCALHWVDKGCPEEDRWALIDAALSALGEISVTEPRSQS